MAIPEIKSTDAEGRNNRSWLELVRQHVASLEYGVVQITVHNGRVTQIERTERTRLDPSITGTFSPLSNNAKA